MSTYEDKRAESERISKRTREFLRRGGRIRSVPATQHQQVYFQRNERALVSSLKEKDCELMP